jgi:hypothetical protein
LGAKTVSRGQRAGSSTWVGSDRWIINLGRVRSPYINDTLVGSYGPSTPNGTWLRDSFHENGCEFSACTEPAPFEGFDFRTSSDVRFKEFFLDAYYERDTTANRRANLEERGLVVSGEQTIHYNDVVIATERIGCRAP